MGKTVQRLPLITETEVATDDLIPIQDVSKPKTRAITIAELIKRVLRAGTIVTAMLADKSVTAAKLADQEAWTDVTYQNGFSRYDATWGNVQYMKDRNNVVHLRGMIKGGAQGAVAFTLPAGYRPTSVELFPTMTSGALGRIDINTNGTVLMNTYNVNWATFSGITFVAG